MSGITPPPSIRYPVTPMHSLPNKTTLEPLTIESLPPEIVSLCFGFLGALDLARCCSVSKSWNQLAGQSLIWKNLMRQNFLELDPLRQDHQKTYARHKMCETNLEQGHYLFKKNPKVLFGKHLNSHHSDIKENDVNEIDDENYQIRINFDVAELSFSDNARANKTVYSFRHFNLPPNVRIESAWHHHHRLIYILKAPDKSSYLLYLDNNKKHFLNLALLPDFLIVDDVEFIPNTDKFILLHRNGHLDLYEVIEGMMIYYYYTLKELNSPDHQLAANNFLSPNRVVFDQGTLFVEYYVKDKSKEKLKGIISSWDFSIPYERTLLNLARSYKNAETTDKQKIDIQFEKLPKRIKKRVFDHITPKRHPVRSDPSACAQAIFEVLEEQKNLKRLKKGSEL